MHPGSASRQGCGPAPFQRRTVGANDGLPLSALVSGSGTGPPLLLLHGFTGSAEAWGDSLLDRLAATHRRVVAMDLLGHGESDRHHDPARYRLDRVIADVEAVQRSLIGEPAIWIGYSMGGRIALAAAALNVAPQRGLVVESGSPGLDDPEHRRMRARSDEDWARVLESDGIGVFVDRWLAQPLFSTQRSLPPEIRAGERERRLAQDPRALAACLRGLGSGVQPSVWSRLGGVDVPTLLIVGALDAKFRHISRTMSALVPEVRRAEVPGVGHAVHLESPGGWTSAVEPWSATR